MSRAEKIIVGPIQWKYKELQIKTYINSFSQFLDFHTMDSLCAYYNCLQSVSMSVHTQLIINLLITLQQQLVSQWYGQNRKLLFYKLVSPPILKLARDTQEQQRYVTKSFLLIIFSHPIDIFLYENNFVYNPKSLQDLRFFTRLIIHKHIKYNFLLNMNILMLSLSLHMNLYHIH